MCRQYADHLGEKRTVTIEYTLLHGVNDHPEHAAELASLLQGFPCKINLIPFKTFRDSDYRRPSAIAVRAFQDRLIAAGFSTMVRTTRGEDIDAACGQLIGNVEDKTQRQAHYKKITRG